MGLNAARKQLRFATGIALQRPFQCLLQVTNRCNMRCSFCDFWSNGVPSEQELTLADYQRIAHELADIGSFLVSIEGGEPFVRPDLLHIGARFQPIEHGGGRHYEELQQLLSRCSAQLDRPAGGVAAAGAND